MERANHSGGHGSCSQGQSTGLEVCFCRRCVGNFYLNLEIASLIKYYNELRNKNPIIFLQVKNELPSTFKAYRFQQHRWSCGPANLFKKMTKEIMLCRVRQLRSLITPNSITLVMIDVNLISIMIYLSQKYTLTLFYYAARVYLEEDSPHLCILLCQEDNCTLGNFFLLLCGYSGMCFGSRSLSSKTIGHIHSCSNHPS